MAKTRPSRFLPMLALCLMGATVLSGNAQADLFDSGADAKAAADKSDAAATHPAGADLDTLIRQAQQERVDGHYQDAVKTLSQLMLVATDDGRVVSEYGKTLVSMGRAQEALGFLTRAQQLRAGDWTLYNALGVAYDQLDRQDDARGAYERALVLKPGDPAVLNNYALSRMLAKDPVAARTLIARAESAGGGADPMIARNIVLIRELAPQVAATDGTQAQPTAAPRVAVSSQPLPQAAATAPRPLQPAPAQVARDNRVVMQRVPVDPLAGPVNAAPAHQVKPATVAQASGKPEPKPAAKTASAKPPSAKPAAKPSPDLPKAVARLDIAPPKSEAPGKTIPALRMSANTY